MYSELSIPLNTMTKQTNAISKAIKLFFLGFVAVFLTSGCGVSSEEDIKESHIVNSTFASDVEDEISFGEDVVFDSGERECRASTIPSRANCAYDINYSKNSNDVKYVESVELMMHLPFDGRSSVEILNRVEAPVALDEEGNIYINVEGNKFERQ